MLTHLRISNYALITSLEITFGPGLNIITGETGAGKSIMLSALSLLLGGRADLKAVRDPQRKSVIEAEFSLRDDTKIKPLLLAADIDWDPEACILRRELSVGGSRSRAFINDTPVNLTTLRDVAIQLVDIHSQHQNLLLADPAYQLSVLDSLADDEPQREQYARAFAAYRSAMKRYAATRDMIKRGRADEEYISFQLQQLREMDLQPGEQAQLEQDRDMMANAATIKEQLTAALEALDGTSAGAVQLIDAASAALDKLCDVMPAAPALSERLAAARAEVRDIAETIADSDAAIAADPSQLDAVEQRLSQIYSLETKHHVDDSDALIELRDKLAAQLQAITNADATLDELTTQAKAAKRAATAAAQTLTAMRTEQAALLATELAERAKPLGMANLRCEIAVTPAKLGPTGADNADFRFAFNKNQPLMPVRATASGGEISRLILALKAIVARRMEMPTMILDEVDTGVSGDVALRMAALMAAMAETAQVIAITHLPQVAARGTTHFKVYKEDDDVQTATHIRLLTPAEREGELALMLSGHADDPSALATARSLLTQHP